MRCETIYYIRKNRTIPSRSHHHEHYPVTAHQGPNPLRFLPNPFINPTTPQ
jgi:hypothetical protein